MVSIRARNVGLRYPVPRDVKLKGDTRTTVGGRIFAGGGRRYITALDDVSFELRAGDRLVSRNLDVQPTLTIRPGWPVRAVILKDLVLKPWRG